MASTTHPHQIELGSDPTLARAPAIASTRSRTSEAELAQEGVPEWSTEEARYVPDCDGEGDVTAVHTPAIADHSKDQLSLAGGAGLGGQQWPLQAVGAEKAAADSAERDEAGPIWVEWAEADSENPYHWSRRRKWVTTVVVCLNCALCNWAGASFGLGDASMMRELGMDRELAALGLAA